MPTPKFKKGISGNPSGRPAGQTPGAKLRTTIEANANEILQSVIDAAVDGDMAACKMLLDRITPTLKPQALPVSLVFQESLALQGSEIIRATVSGQIAPDIGSQLISALASQSKIVEIDDLTKRIEILEATK
jgi:hypothetical protein